MRGALCCLGGKLEAFMEVGLAASALAAMRRVAGCLCTLMMLLSALAGVLLLTPPFLPCAVWRPSVFSAVADVMVGFWHVFAVALYELALGVKIVVSGKVRKSAPGECVLAVMNHRTRIDWLFFFSYQLRYGSLRDLKIVLKDFLKHLPGCGWAMQTVVFPFLRRRWAQDSGLMASRFRYYCAVGSRPHLLLFPEGTDLTPSTLRASHAFAAKQGWPPLTHVLQPRTTGFVFALAQLRRLGLCHKVLDVTVGYPRGVPRGEGDLVRGEYPREVHFHVEELDAQALPVSQKELEDWCRQRWAAKEERLARFYESRTFEQTPQQDGGTRAVEEREARRRMYTALLFWPALVVLCCVCLALSPWFRLYMAVSAAVFLLLDCCWLGLDELLTRCALVKESPSGDLVERSVSNGRGHSNGTLGPTEQ